MTPHSDRTIIFVTIGSIIWVDNYFPFPIFLFQSQFVFNDYVKFSRYLIGSK